MKKEPGVYWSLRNKTEDVQRALARGDLRWARLAASELGVRLSTAAVPPLHAGSAAPQTPPDANDQYVDAVLATFGKELSRLVAFLKQDAPAPAAEVVELLFELLDTLDQKGGR